MEIKQFLGNRTTLQIIAILELYRLVEEDQIYFPVTLFCNATPTYLLELGTVVGGAFR